VINNSVRTAIRRGGPSLPARVLEQLGLIERQDHIADGILDFGCGKGDDCRWLNCEGYDPFHSTEKYGTYDTMPFGKYSTVLCTYVLNVVSCTERVHILRDIYDTLYDRGIAYITVRRDIDKDFTTKAGTKQYVVRLDLPVVKENKQFCIYQMSKRYHRREEMWKIAGMKTT